MCGKVRDKGMVKLEDKLASFENLAGSCCRAKLRIAISFDKGKEP